MSGPEGIQGNEGISPANGVSPGMRFVEHLIAKGMKISVVESGGKAAGLLIESPTTKLFHGKIPSEIKIEKGKSDVESVLEAHKNGRLQISSIDGNLVRDIITVSGPIFALITDAQHVIEEEAGIPLEERVVSPIVKTDPELSLKLAQVIRDTPRPETVSTNYSKKEYNNSSFVDSLALLIADIAKRAPRGKLQESAMKQLIAFAQKHDEVLRGILHSAARSDREADRVEKREAERSARVEHAEKHDDKLVRRQDRIERREMLLDLMIDWIEAHESHLDTMELRDIREALGQLFDPAAISAKYFERLGRPETTPPKAQAPEVKQPRDSEIPPAL